MGFVYGRLAITLKTPRDGDMSVMACVLKNYFRAEITRQFVRKWLIVRSRNRAQLHEITVLVPFSTDTPDFNTNPNFGD